MLPKLIQAPCLLVVDPKSAADRFSYESTFPSRPTFGFHGLGNMWCHVEDSEMIACVAQLAPYARRSHQFVRLLISYFIFSKFRPLMALYARLRAQAGADEIQRLLGNTTTDPGLAKGCTELCEELHSQSYLQAAAGQRVSPQPPTI
jgi:hypothetical protein